MKILITGANGLLGSRVAGYLSKEHEVYAIVRKIPDVKIHDVKYHVVDFSRNWSFYGLPDQVDTIIHLAQSDNFRNFPEKALDIFLVNVDSTARLLEYARLVKASKFIYASSGGVYGCGNTEFDENSPLGLHDELGYYLGSKLCGEILVQNYTSCFNVIALRLFFVYGPKQNRSMLIPRLIDNIKSKQKIYLNGPDGIKINPIHVNDAAESLVKSLNLNSSYKINIAGFEVLSIKQIATIIGSKLGVEPFFEINELKQKNLIANIDLMKDMLISPSIPFTDGVECLIHN